MRMPSTRLLAEQHSVARITVILAYERLIAEGYLQTRPAAGTFVAGPVPARAEAGSSPLGGIPQAVDSPPRVALDFSAGTLDPTLFPLRRCGRCCARSWTASAPRTTFPRPAAARPCAALSPTGLLRPVVSRRLPSRSSCSPRAAARSRCWPNCCSGPVSVR
jgi:GntR family transcriptional regulator/MocR family aminotransferase